MKETKKISAGKCGAPNKTEALKSSTSTIFRISGILFFILTMFQVVEVFNINATTIIYILSDESSKAWNFFFAVTSILYTSSFLFSVIATGTAALFGGKQGNTQSVWNLSVYSLVSLALYTGLELTTGLDSENSFIFLGFLLMAFFFCIIVFVCLKELKSFSWINIICRDANSKLCIKVYLVMLLLLYVVSFFWAHSVIG